VTIFDDASSDDSAEVAAALAAEDKRVAVVPHGANAGHIATYNACIERAEGDYMLILSADDFLLPGALARAAAVLDAHPEVGLAPGAWLRYQAGDPLPDTEGDAAEPRFPEPGELLEWLAFRNRIGTATAIVRTGVQKRLGHYRPDLPHAADLEMWLRFAIHSRLALLRSRQAVYRRHGRNLSAGFGRAADLEECLAAFELHFAAIRRLPDGPAIEARVRGHLEARRRAVAAPAARDAPRPGGATAVIILNWKRPQNIGRIVRTASEALPDARILVIDQAEGTDRLAGRSDVPRALCTIREQANEGAGVRVRLAAEWGFDHYLCIDDDIFLSAGQMQALVERLRAEPDVVHGVAGQIVEPRGESFRLVDKVVGEGPVSIVNNVYAFSRARAQAALRLAGEMGYARWSDARRTDDVLLSCGGPGGAQIHALGRWRVCATRAAEGIAVHRSAGFFEERIDLVRRLIGRGAIYVKPPSTPMLVFGEYRPQPTGGES
jgi:hypothetical protein